MAGFISAPLGIHDDEDESDGEKTPLFFVPTFSHENKNGP
jgi:hypothetical protein